MQILTASSTDPELLIASMRIFAMISVSVVVVKIWPACSYSARGMPVLTRFPLWATEMKCSWNWKFRGWIFSGRFEPVVG